MKIKLNLWLITLSFTYQRSMLKHDLFRLVGLAPRLGSHLNRALDKHAKQWRKVYPKRKRQRSHWVILIPEALMAALMSVHMLLFLSLTLLICLASHFTLLKFFVGIGMTLLFLFLAWFFWLELYNVAAKHKVNIRLR